VDDSLGAAAIGACALGACASLGCELAVEGELGLAALEWARDASLCGSGADSFGAAHAQSAQASASAAAIGQG